MKPTDLDENHFATGNRGHIFVDHEAHIAKKGFDPNTLCGIPMLFNNYVKEAEWPLTICSHCEDEYRQLTGTKIAPFKELLEEHKLIVAQLYDIDSLELARPSLSTILQLLCKGDEEDVDTFLEAMAEISEEDPEAEPIAWVEEYLLQDDNHKTI